MVHVLAHAQQAVYLICVVIVLLHLYISCNRWVLKMNSAQTAMVALWFHVLAHAPGRLTASSAWSSTVNGE